VEKAKAAEEELQRVYNKAKAEETAAGKRVEKAEERAAKAREEAKKAQEEAAKAKELTEKAAEYQAAEEQRQAAEKQAGGDSKQTEDAAESESAAGGADGERARFKDNSDKIAEAAAKVKKEMSDLEGCQKELADARARLRDLMAKEQELARQRREQRELEKARWEAKLAALAREEAKAAAELAEREGKASQKRGQEKVQEDTLSNRKEAHQVADGKYKEIKTDYDVLHAELKKAEQNLRKFRQKEDAGGGVSNSDQPAGRTQMLGSRSGASCSGICAAMIALIMVIYTSVE